MLRHIQNIITLDPDPLGQTYQDTRILYNFKTQQTYFLYQRLFYKRNKFCINFFLGGLTRSGSIY